MTESTDEASPPAWTSLWPGCGSGRPSGSRRSAAAATSGGGTPTEEREYEMRLRFLQQHVRAGSSFLYLNVSYLTEATLRRAACETAPPGTGPAREAVGASGP